jgi:hypothetical protein
MGQPDPDWTYLGDEVDGPSTDEYDGLYEPDIEEC